MKEVGVKMENDAYAIFKKIADGSNRTVEDVVAFFLNLGIESLIVRNREKIKNMNIKEEKKKWIYKKTIGGEK